MKKKELEYYQNLMKQKFDWEDKIVTIGNEIWKKSNEKLKSIHQLRLFFKRERIEIEKNEK